MEQLILAIKNKKELQELDNEFIEDKIKQYFLKNPNKKKVLEQKDYNKKSKIFKEVVKEIRALLREIYGVFQKVSKEKRWQLYKKFLGSDVSSQNGALLDLLRTHQSTRERAPYYDELYKKLFSITGQPKDILDLGCGFNPLAYSFLGCTPTYTAADISSAQMDFLDSFFEDFDISASAATIDLLDTHQRGIFKQQHDLVFMFKLVDTLESQKKNISKIIIKELFEYTKPKHIIVSFATKTISGKVLRSGKKENWFSKFLKKEKLQFTIVSIPNEEFWIVHK